MRRADHPAVGMILDSWHVLSRGLPVDPIRAIPADRITFVQLADAPRMDMDLLQWSRHFRNFPGQGDLPVDDFMAAVEATGYDGWLSHEIFNDRFRMASPRRIAEDGERSLIWLDDRMQPGPHAAARRAAGGGVDRVRGRRRTTPTALAALFAGLGFRADRAAPLEAGDALGAGRDQPRHQHRARGPGAFAPDRARAVGGGDRAPGRRRRRRRWRAPRRSGWPSFRQPVGPGELDIPAIRGLGGSLVYFTDAASELGRVWEIEFEPDGRAPDGPLTRIDHVAQSMSPDEMLSWRLWYLSLFDFEHHAAGGRGRPGRDRREHGAAGRGPARCGSA